MGEWLQRLGLERYEHGLLHNGWDDLEFLRYSYALTHILYWAKSAFCQSLL